MNQSGKSFKSLWCEKRGCPASEFEQQLFWHCLHRHALLLAPLIAHLSPSFFTEDFAFFREVGDTRSRGELINEANRFYGRNLRDRNWLRKTLGIRVSAKRFLHLSVSVFSGATGS